MDNPGEILRLCRLCLVKDQVNIPIFEEQGDIRQIFLKISSCLPVKVSRDDQLPKKICDGCLNKLDLLYEFWNTSVNAEKTLLSWLGQAGVKDADEKISAVAQQIAKSAETQVKQEALEDGHAPEVQSFEEEAKDESEAPPPKRARRTAAVKAQINITPESDDDDDMDSAEAMTKVEDESDESDGEDKDPSYGEVPGTSADDQAGPSGVGKDGVEAPSVILLSDTEDDTNIVEVKKGNMNDQEEKMVKKLYCNKCGKLFTNIENLHRHLFNPQDKDHIFRCERCDKVVGHTLMQLTEHMEYECLYDTKSAKINPKTVKFKYYCERCGKIFGFLAELDKHYNTHANERICCTLCPNEQVTTCSLDRMLKHFKSHYFYDNVDLCCKTCNLHFYAVPPYKLHHVLVHSNFTDISYKCMLCAQNFTDVEQFEWHVQGHSKIVNTTNKNIHRSKQGVTDITCEICAEMFDDAKTCRNHKIKCHKVNALLSEKKKCPFCSNMIKAMHILNHISNHKRTKPLRKTDKLGFMVRCETCGELKPIATISEHKKMHRIKRDTCETSKNEKASEQNKFVHNKRESKKSESKSSRNQKVKPKRTIKYAEPTMKQSPRLVEKNQQIQKSKPVSLLSRHVPNPARCNLCDQSFMTLLTLKEHMRSHSDSNIPAWTISPFQHSFVPPEPQDIGRTLGRSVATDLKLNYPTNVGSLRTQNVSPWLNQTTLTAGDVFSSSIIEGQSRSSQISKANETIVRRSTSPTTNVQKPWSDQQPSIWLERRSRSPDKRLSRTLQKRETLRISDRLPIMRETIKQKSRDRPRSRSPLLQSQNEGTRKSLKQSSKISSGYGSQPSHRIISPFTTEKPKSLLSDEINPWLTPNDSKRNISERRPPLTLYKEQPFIKSTRRESPSPPSRGHVLPIMRETTKQKSGGRPRSRSPLLQSQNEGTRESLKQSSTISSGYGSQPSHRIISPFRTEKPKSLLSDEIISWLTPNDSKRNLSERRPPLTLYKEQSFIRSIRRESPSPPRRGLVFEPPSQRNDSPEMSASVNLQRNSGISVWSATSQVPSNQLVVGNPAAPLYLRRSDLSGSQNRDLEASRTFRNPW